MSYDLTAYVLRPSETPEQVAQQLSGEVEMDDDYDGLPLTDDMREAVRDACMHHGMQREDSPLYEGFAKGPLQIHVYPTQVSITVPYWESAAGFLEEGLAIAKALSEGTGLRFWDPQEGSWVNAATRPTQFANTAESVQRRHRKRKPWWKFW